MPTLTFPASYPPSDGDTFNATNVNDWFYDPAAPDESLAIVNGYLDWDNLDANLLVGAEYTQRGSFVYGEKASGTANLDYRWTWFGEWRAPTLLTDWSVSEYDPYQPIPGACKTIYAKWTARA